MRKYLAILLILLLAIPMFGQSGTSGRIRYGATLPSTCTPLTGDVFFLTSGSSPGLYQCLAVNTWQRSGPGSVTSIGLALPNIFSVSGSPVTTSGTITATLASQTANKAFLSPDGSSGSPTFRKIVTGDVNSANLSGNATTLGTTTGSLPSNNLAAFDASGNIKDSGIASGSFPSLSAPIHTVLLGTGTGTVGNTATGTAGLCLVSNGAGADPTYQTCGTGIPASGTYTSEKSLCSSGCDFSTLASAIASIGSTSQTLIVADSITIGSNVTVPSTLALRFAGIGNITVSDGFTLTDLGLIFAPSRQIFFNATAGHGTINCGNASAVNSTDGFTPQEKHFWAEWWGAVGDNVTHSADQLDAAFLALPNGSTMHLGGKFYYLEHGITFGYKLQASLVGNDTEVGLAGHLIKPIFVYHGTIGGVVFTAKNVYSCTFKGFGVYGSDGSSPNQAATNFLLTYDAAVGANPNISSHCYLIALQIWALSTRTDWRGIFITNTGGNNEHHTIRECEFIGQDPFGTDQIAIDMAQSQVQRVIIERNNFSSVGVCVQIQGNILAYNNIYGSVGTVWKSIQANDNCVIIGDDAEQLVRVFDASAVNGAVTIAFISCKYNAFVGVSQTALVVADAPIHMSAPVNLSFYNCNFDNALVTGQDFGPFFLGNEAGTQPSVEFHNCIIGTASDMSMYGRGFSTCHTNFKSGEIDMRWGGNTGESVQLLKVAAPSTSATRVLLEMAGPTNATQPDPLVFGGAYGVGGLFPITPLALSIVGTPGSTTYRITVIGVDAKGRRTAMFTLPNTNHFLLATTGNATLSGSNYLHMTWLAQFPAPDHFEVYDVNPADAAQWRLVSNVSPSGGSTEHYDIITSPTGPYVFNQPAYNEAGLINFRNLALYPAEVSIPDGTATPNVALANDIVLANSGATFITNFLNGTEGQILRIRPTDNNTIIQNNASVNLGGSNLTLVSGIPLSLIFRSSVWYRLR